MTIPNNEHWMKHHRVRSASAIFQKGIYHLYVVKHEKTPDAFSHVVRMYQCAYLLGIAQLLLDFSVEINIKKHPDPAAEIKHTQIEEWVGFKTKHPLYDISSKSHIVFKRLIDARNNLIYRPYYKNTGGDSWLWEDCTLKELLRDIPDIEEIEEVYKAFYQAIQNWTKAQRTSDSDYVDFFVIYMRQTLLNTGMTILQSYTQLLNPNDQAVLKAISEYKTYLLGE